MGVCTITMNRPEKRNARPPNWSMNLSWHSKPLRNKTVCVVVLAGAGGAFCAGADLSLMSGGGEEDPDIPQR